MEETGFDVSKLLKKDEYIELIFGQQRVRLYIIAGVKDDTHFAPQTKKEISVCDSFHEWIYFESYYMLNIELLIYYATILNSSCFTVYG